MRRWFETGKDWISATKWGTTTGVVGATVLVALFQGNSFWGLVTSFFSIIGGYVSVDGATRNILVACAALLAAGIVGYSMGWAQQRSLGKSFLLTKDNIWVKGSIFGWVGGQTVAILTIWLLIRTFYYIGVQSWERDWALHKVFELFPDYEVMLLVFNIIYWFVFGGMYGAITCKSLHTIMMEAE